MFRLGRSSAPTSSAITSGTTWSERRRARRSWSRASPGRSSPMPRRANGSIDQRRLKPSTSTRVFSTVRERTRSGAAAASSKPTGPPMSCTTRWKRSSSRASTALGRSAPARSRCNRGPPAARRGRGPAGRVRPRGGYGWPAPRSAFSTGSRRRARRAGIPRARRRFYRGRTTRSRRPGSAAPLPRAAERPRGSSWPPDATPGLARASRCGDAGTGAAAAAARALPAARRSRSHRRSPQNQRSDEFSTSARSHCRKCPAPSTRNGPIRLGKASSIRCGKSRGITWSSGP